MRKVILGVSALLIGAGAFAFTPTGSYDISGRYYGQAEDGVAGVNDGNSGARIQHIIRSKFTENDSIEVRVRDFQDLNGSNSREQRREDTEVRVRLTHDFGNILGSKVGHAGRVQYRKNGSSKHLEYGHKINFAKYGFDNSVAKTADLTLMPNYRYTWLNNGDHINTIGVDLYTYTNLPKNVDFEFNIYSRRNEGTNSATYSYDVEAYLYKTMPLFAIKGYELSLNVEGGLDCYSSVAKKSIGNLSVKDGEYSLYAYPNLGFSKKLTDKATFYGSAGAEYRNWGIAGYDNAQDWRWQPTATVGAKVLF